MADKSRLLKAALKALQKVESLGENLSYKDFFVKALDVLKPHRKQLLDAFIAWAPPISEIPKARVFGESQVYHTAALATALLVTEEGSSDTPLPENFLPYLQLVPHLTIYDAFEPCRRACAHLPAAMLKEAIVDAQREWGSTYAISLVSCIANDVELVEAVVRGVNVGERSAEDYAEKFQHIGEPLLVAVEAVWTPDLGRHHAESLLMALNRLALPQSGPFYVKALGHKSKPVQALAQTGLSLLGAHARPALESGVKARKKAIREFCSGQLTILGPAAAGADGETVEEGFRSLAPAVRDSMSERINAVRENTKLRTKFFTEMAEEPVLWFEAMLEVFSQSVGRHDIQYLVAATLGNNSFAVHQEAFWGRYLTFLGRHNIADAHDQWRLMKHVDALPPGLSPEVFERAYLGAAGPFMVKLLPKYYAQQRPPSIKLVLQGIKHRSKPVREAAVRAGPMLTEGLDAIVALLGERKKATRQGAADVLRNAKPNAVAPYKGQLQAALVQESVSEIQATLKHALAQL